MLSFEKRNGLIFLRSMRVRSLAVLLGASTTACSLSFVSSSALAYGVTITSSTGASISGSFRQFEFGLLDKIAESLKESKIEPNSRLEVVVDQSGKVVDAKFLVVPPAEAIKTEAIAKLKSLTFSPIPGIEQGTLSLTFFYAELSSPPYKMNSLQIRSAGSIRAGDAVPPEGRGQFRNRVGENNSPPQRFGGNRITGPLQLGPPNLASALPPAGVSPLRAGANEPLEKTQDFRRLNYLLIVAAANKNYDEAQKVHARIMELCKDADLTDKVGAARAAFRWPGLAMTANRVDDAKKAFSEALTAIDKLGDDAATVSTISTLNNLSMKFVSKNELATADSGIRKSIEICAIHIRNGASSDRVSLAAPVRNIVAAYERRKEFDKAIDLEKYRLEKTKYGEADNTAALVVCQMDLARVMLSAVAANVPNKSRYAEKADEIFANALADTKNAFGADSQEYKNTLSRQISDYAAAGQSESASRLQKLQ